MKLTAGIDIGSLSTEVVLMEANANLHGEAGGNPRPERLDSILAFSIVLTGASIQKAMEQALEAALGKAGADFSQIEAVVATGYGRRMVSFAQRAVTEITCHGQGAHYLFPQARTVIDVGGQDSKVIRLSPGGEVVDFVMNDKCAAGTGRFLEVMARALETDIAGLHRLAGRARQAASISSTCTVFAESEVVSLIAQGRSRSEIALGLLQSVAARIAGLAGRVGVEPPVAMTGGVAKSNGIARILGDILGTPILVPPEPQIVGALGAALIAQRMVALGQVRAYRGPGRAGSAAGPGGRLR